MINSTISQVIGAEVALWKTRHKHLSLFCLRHSECCNRKWWLEERGLLRWGSAVLSQLPFLPWVPCPVGLRQAPQIISWRAQNDWLYGANGTENLFYVSGVHQINCKRKWILASSPCSLFLSLLVNPRSRLSTAAGSTQNLTAGVLFSLILLSSSFISIFSCFIQAN